MDNYIELKKSLHFIDRENDLATSKDLSKIDKQTKNNINEIISKVYHHENCREYIPQKASFVIEKILEITRDISLWNKYVDQFANKLLEKEITKQKEITKRFSNVTKGSLLQVLYQDKSDNENFYYIVTKINHFKFISESRLQMDVGIPEIIKVYKSAVININKNKIVSSKLYDNGTTVRKYWWNDFLELNPVVNDTLNTNSVCKIVRSSILKFTKGSERDLDRKSLFGRFHSYMDSCSTYNYTEMMKALFGNYINHNPKLNLDGIKNDIKKENGKFDKQFDVDKKELRKQTAKQTFNIGNSISAKIPDYLTPDKEIIFAYEKDDGGKYLHLKLENEKLYNRFVIYDEN
ncbi:MAG: hypothetical protein HN921_08920 [Bacteroidetes bacterium]|jgi:hypothetical protein|nr:hypothetical protein [Bacteroidota bacterium]